MTEREMLAILNRPKGFKLLKNFQLIMGGIFLLCALMLIIGAFR